MTLLSKVVGIVEQISERSGRIFSWLIVLVTIVMVFEVFMRRILGSPTVWATEIATRFYGMYFILLMAYTLLYDEHVRIDVLYSRWSKKTRSMVDIAGYGLFFLLFCLWGLIGGSLYAWSSFATQEGSGSVFNAVLWPAKASIVLGFGLLFIQGIADLIKKVEFLRKGSNNES
jgi:TRAP-type mannitol/chloroaromatic compound transport system permease small subunit